MAKKTTQTNSDNSDIPRRVPKHGRGKLLLHGVPGNKGGPGRPKLEFKAWCAALLDNPTNREQVEQVLGNHAHPAHPTLWKAVADRVHGRPQQNIVTSGDAAAPLTIRVIHSTIEKPTP